MTRRALLLGSQTGGLSGVHADVELMRTTMEALDFQTTVLTDSATRDRVLDAYRELVSGTADGDAVLVYYSGHGARLRNPLAGHDGDEAAYVQFIVPTDFDDAPEGEFRGIFAEELSLLQAELTRRTPNVTTVLDCCHSARMSRDASRLPRARDVRGLISMDAVAAARKTVRNLVAAHSNLGGAFHADANPFAVRVVACAPDQSAYEVDLPDGTRHGALTAALARMLADRSRRRFTWRELLDHLRPAVTDLSEFQRPEIEGPVDRYVFTSHERKADGVLPVVVEAGEAYLDVPSFFGLGPGDLFDLVADGDRDARLASAVVADVVAGRPHLVLRDGELGGRTTGVEAWPVRVAFGRRPVAVVPSDNPAGQQVVAALAASTHTVVVGSDAPGMLARVDVGDEGFRLCDAAGEPLTSQARSIDAASLTSLRRDVGQLARAAHLRDLSSGVDAAALPDDVVVEYFRLAMDGETPAELTVETGEHLFDGDRIVVRLRNTGSEQRFVSVFDIGLRGAITHLSTSEPSGLTLAPGDVYDLGRTSAGALTGIEVFWPDNLPRSGPRPESIVVLIMDRRQDLRVLSQTGVTRSAGQPLSELERLTDALSSGLRDARPLVAGPQPVRYRVTRLDILLHPQRRGDAREPVFEIDNRPDPSFRWMTPRSSVSVPDRVAVRLSEVVVHSNRAILRSRVRVDAMVITRTSGPAAVAPPYQAATARFDRVQDGDRLPLDNLLLYEGPVFDFLDVAIWVARDEQAELDLADLFKREIGKEDVGTALATLAGLAVAAPQAAVAVAAVAAVATLVRTGAALLDKAVGKSIGVYRTSLLPCERFGAGDPVARHPGSGLLRAQDMSFAFEVVAS